MNRNSWNSFQKSFVSVTVYRECSRSPLGMCIISAWTVLADWGRSTTTNNRCMLTHQQHTDTRDCYAMAVFLLLILGKKHEKFQCKCVKFAFFTSFLLTVFQKMTICNKEGDFSEWVNVFSSGSGMYVTKSGQGRPAVDSMSNYPNWWLQLHTQSTHIDYLSFICRLVQQQGCVGK